MLPSSLPPKFAASLPPKCRREVRCRGLLDILPAAELAVARTYTTSLTSAAPVLALDPGPQPREDALRSEVLKLIREIEMEITKEDDKLRYKMERIPFLEEQVRKIRQNGKIISMDIEKLLLSEENRFAFVNEVAAEATSYIEKNRDEYGFKKAILHVLSNRMNEAGFYRTEAYMEPDPFKPGPNYLKEGFD
uniref:Protein PLASTID TRANSCRIPTIONALLY ACTIVE 7 n=1 Tax=Ananas comosus var. bracteatus TaxID=296719 RepID=A0A6V7NIP4_ANACO|nr:unnamed protein product [Ananas comosus var. bracteatus]